MQGLILSMVFTRKLLIFFSGILLFQLVSCEAPRNNPLDPISNEIPYIQELTIYSIVTNRYSLPLQKYEVVIKAKIQDLNQVIDSVYVENSYLNIKKFLQYNYNERVYERTLSIYDLKTDKFEDIVGHEFRLKIKDFSSKIFDLGAESIKRVILNDIKITSPINGETVSNPLRLNWEKFSSQFSFSYKIQLYTDEYPADLIWENDQLIPSDSTSALVDVQLPEGEYYWVIWGIDQFQNRFSSKPATFKVD